MMFIFACSRRLGNEPEHSTHKDYDVNCKDTRVIFITKTKTKTKTIAIRLLKLKLELKYRQKLKLFKNYIDSWLNELKLELNNAKTEMN